MQAKNEFPMNKPVLIECVSSFCAYLISPLLPFYWNPCIDFQVDDWNPLFSFHFYQENEILRTSNWIQNESNCTVHLNLAMLHDQKFHVCLHNNQNVCDYIACNINTNINSTPSIRWNLTFLNTSFGDIFWHLCKYSVVWFQFIRCYSWGVQFLLVGILADEIDLHGNTCVTLEREEIMKYIQCILNVCDDTENIFRLELCVWRCLANVHELWCSISSTHYQAYGFISVWRMYWFVRIPLKVSAFRIGWFIIHVKINRLKKTHMNWILCEVCTHTHKGKLFGSGITSDEWLNVYSLNKAFLFILRASSIHSLVSIQRQILKFANVSFRQFQQIDIFSLSL